MEYLEPTNEDLCICRNGSGTKSDLECMINETS